MRLHKLVLINSSPFRINTNCPIQGGPFEVGNQVLIPGPESRAAIQTSSTIPRFVSAPASLNLQGRFGLFVSALKIPFPRNGASNTHAALAGDVMEPFFRSAHRLAPLYDRRP